MLQAAQGGRVGLRELYAGKFKSRKAFERATGVSYQTIWRTEKGETVPERETLEAFSRVLGISVDDVLAGIRGSSVRETNAVEIDQPQYRIPVRALVHAGEAAEAVEIPEEPIGFEWSAHAPDDDCDVLQIVGDSMEPDFSDGDRIVVCRSTVPSHGTLVLAEHHPYGDEYRELTVKVYAREGKAELLVPLNPRYEVKHLDREFWTIRGVIVKHIRKTLAGRYADLASQRVRRDG